jgi:hypothetical protein
MSGTTDKIKGMANEAVGAVKSVVPARDEEFRVWGDSRPPTA